MRSSSAGWRSTASRSSPSSSSETAELLSSFAMARNPIQCRNRRAASTRRWPQNGPLSSPSVVANAIGSWIVVASITKPPSSSCWCFRQCAEIG